MKEELFGNYVTFDLTAGVAEYSLSTNIPRFGGIIKVEIKYGATGDDWIRADRLESIAHWKIQNNVSTSYRSKTEALYYIIEDAIGFIPTPPSGDSGTVSVRVWYVRRPYQITLSTDVIDIDYRFTYPIADYVQAKAIQRENEDYATASQLEISFRQQLEEIANAANSEYGEYEETSFVNIPTNSLIFNNPL